MSLKKLLASICIGTAAVLSVSASSAAESDSISLDNVPGKVLDAASKAVPGVKFEKAGTEVEHGKLVYELKAMSKDGLAIEVDVTPNGKILEIERQIRFESAPENVRQALDRAFPGFKPVFCEHSTRCCGATWFEFEGDLRGREVDIEVSSSARHILLEDDSMSAPAQEEREMRVEDAPARVYKAAKAATDAKLTACAIEVEEGVVTYEFKGVNAKGKNVEVDVDSEGRLLEIETEINSGSVPVAVHKAIERRMPGFQAAFIELSVRPASTWYEFEGKDATGRKTDVEVRADGRVICIEEDDDTDVRAKAQQ